MTEAEWLACTNPFTMTNPVQAAEEKGLAACKRLGITIRRLILYDCACCRRAWHLLGNEATRQAIIVAERFADHVASVAELKAACEAASDFRAAIEYGRVATDGDAESVLNAAREVERASTPPETNDEMKYWELGSVAHGIAKVLSQGQESAFQAEWSFHADLLRDILGNPFRPITFAPEWRTDTALALAHQMYETREFGAMPILADALQDAGCDNTGILDHCRGPGPHVRGCWVVDLVLGKE